MFLVFKTTTNPVAKVMAENEREHCEKWLLFTFQLEYIKLHVEDRRC